MLYTLLLYPALSQAVNVVKNISVDWTGHVMQSDAYKTYNT